MHISILRFKNKLSISKFFLLFFCFFSIFSKVAIASDIEERIRIVTPEGEEKAICETIPQRNINLCWAKFYKSEGKLDLAFEYYDKAFKINPKDVQAYFSRGLLFIEQEKLDLAISDFSKVIEIKPDDPQAYGGINLVYDAFRNGGLLYQAYGNRGGIYFKRGELEKALSDFNQVIKINPKEAKAYFDRGLVFQKMGNAKAAISNLEKARQLYIDQDYPAYAEEVDKVLKKLE